MRLIEIKYRDRVYHRRSTYGGTDTESAGSSIEELKTNVLVADNSQIGQALAWHDQAHAHSDAYKRIEHRAVCEVHAILRRPITNLSLA